jgi:hypothetical protein
MSDNTNTEPEVTTSKPQVALNWIKTFFSTTIPTLFNNAKTSVSNMETWKKWLIGIAVLIIIFIGSNAITGLVCYYKGTDTCKQTSPTTITPATTPPEHTTVYIKKNECGNKVDLTAKMINNKKLEVIGKTKCVETKKYFDIDFNCPVQKWGIGIAPGASLFYDSESSKIIPMIGGNLYFKRYFGNFSIGPMLGYYQSLNNKAFNGTANILLEYKF